MSNIKRLDDPSVPIASTAVGLIMYGMQGGQTVKVLPSLLESDDPIDGINGKSAYEVAVDNGFVGTAAQWLESLIGNSAYEDWLAGGKTGTFQDFLDEIVETVNLLIPQTLTEAQKAQVRENIDALASSVINEELGKKADHGYTAEETPKTLKEVDTLANQNADDIAQLAGDVSLLDAVQGAKIKDIENVLSTANLGQSAQLSVSGRKTVSLPKNASNGGMNIRMEGLTAENLVTNGDFRNGLTGWTAYGAGTPVVESGYVKYTPASIAGAISNGLKQLSVGNKWYVRTIIKSSSPVACAIGFAKSGVGTLLVTGNIGTSDTTISGILTIANADINEFIVGRPTVIQDIYIKNAFAINLTATLGAGNEPDLATCNAMFSDYFEGVKSFVPTGRVRSVGKNLWFEPKAVNSFDSRTLQCTVNDMGQYLKVTGPGTLLKKIYLHKGTYKLVVDGYADSGSLGIVGIYFVGGAGLGSTVFDNSRSVKTSANIVVSESGFYDVRYYPSNSSSTGHNMYIYSAMMVLSDASVTYEPYRETSLYLTSPELRSNGAVKDEIRKGTNGYELVKRISDVDGTVLATPVITPISFGGILNSAENGTVYHEPIIADAGVYDTKMPILLTDYPISALEEIIKHENGIDTYLDVSTAVIAGDKLSFTHPSLQSGDLVLFTYAFSKESTNGNITATFYDSNVVKIDTVTGKAYKITDVITNGVLTRSITEV